jgi:hypothetical protein
MAGRRHVPQLLTGFMTRIVTTTCRYKRPAKKRKAVALEAPAIVAAKSRPLLGRIRRRPRFRNRPPHDNGAARSIKHTARSEARRIAGRKPAIVTARKPRGD